MKLVTIANLKGQYYKPRVDMELLKENSEGIICLSGCPASKLSRAVIAKNYDLARSLIKEHQEIFGKENYFLEVQSHPKIDFDKDLRENIVKLAKEFDIPVVGTQDSHYPCKDDHEAHHTLLAINTGTEGKDGGKFEFSDDDFSIIDEKTAREYFKDTPEAVDNTRLVADMCEDYDLELGNAYFPEYIIESGKSADDELKYLAYNGFEFRKLEKTKEYVDRLEYELQVIQQKGYPAYFLVVGDLLRYARENGILTNIRGSVAGSITTYLLGITNVDPIEYRLPFERFLNPERPSLPDIDMDYADNRRDEIISYAKQKYGEDRVAQIGTFGTMMAKGSVRDVARALGYPYTTGDRISKMIPLGSQGFPMTIDKAMEMIPELEEAYENEKDTKEIIDLAKKMEGCVRHISVHAAGVVIAPGPLYEFTPIQYDPKGDLIITQYDMYSIEDAGLPKFDFLGIRNLAILADAVKLVKKIHNVDIDLDNLNLKDRKTFEMLARGETMGLFQLNGSGLTRYLKELKPSSIHDINAMVALYRPGPMQFIPLYIERKHNPRLVKYFDPALEKILKQTYGVLVYQDDLLLIAIEIAGYGWGEVDKFRKAVGKKIPEEMAKQKDRFIQGCIEHSKWPLKKATELWNWIEPFAAYGFNKAHSASYGLVAYQTAYMKANFPVEYMSAILTAESGDVDKVSEIVAECIKMDITVLPPDVNESFGGFTVIKGSNYETDRTIRFGLYTIKNLGKDISDAIIEERKNNGTFKSLSDFFERIIHKNLNKKSVEALTKSGALDTLGERGEILENLETLLTFNKEFRNTGNTQDSLFGSMGGIQTTLNLKKAEVATLKDKLSWEKELLGLYISGHPLDPYKDKIEKSANLVKQIKDSLRVGMPVTMAVIITEVKVTNTKNNTRMAFLKIADFTGSIEAVIFSKTFEEHRDILEKDRIVALQGKTSDRNGERSIIIEKVKAI